VGTVFLAFFVLGSSGSSSTRPCSRTCSGVAFLLVFLEYALWVGGVSGTYWGPCFAGACTLSLASELSGEEIISSTCMGSRSEVLADLGVRGSLCEANLENFLEGLAEVLWVFLPVMRERIKIQTREI